LRFHVIEDRPFLTLTPSLTEIIGKMAFSEPPGDVKGAVVRVRYTVTEDEARKVDQAAIRRDLLALGAAKVVLRPTVERTVRARVAEMHEDLTEAAALELWLDSQGINGSQADALRAAHLEYVARLGQA
jgi:hypothetical protein